MTDGIDAADFSGINLQDLLAEVMEVAMSTGKSEGQRLAIECARGHKAVERTFYAGLAAAGYAFQRVSQADHRTIILRLMEELNLGNKPDPKEILEAYRVEIGKPAVWVTKIFRRKFEKYLRELLPELMDHTAFILMKENDMLDQTQRANLIASTFTGFTNHVYKQSQIARDVGLLKKLAVIDRQEKAELRARIEALEARANATEDWRKVAERMWAQDRSYQEIAVATGMKRDTVAKFVQRNLM